jgi:hypothetical protein
VSLLTKLTFGLWDDFDYVISERNRRERAGRPGNLEAPAFRGTWDSTEQPYEQTRGNYQAWCAKKNYQAW